MKKTVIFLCVLTHILLSAIINLANAQQAKLVKQGEWGSDLYRQIITLNNYYYATTNSDQIDIIDPSKTGVESFIGQIDLGSEIFSIQAHNNQLVVVTETKLSIYDISNTKDLILKYSIAVKGHSNHTALLSSDNIYYLDADNKFYVIKENNDAYSIEKVINSTLTNDYHAIHLFLSDSYFYALGQYNEDSKYITKIEKYRISDNSFIETVESEAIGYLYDITYASSERFIIAAANKLSLVNITNNKLNILTSFADDGYSKVFQLAYKDKVLHALSWSRELYTYAIADDNLVTLLSEDPLYSYLADASSFSQLKWFGEKLTALSVNEGIIEVEFLNGGFDNIKYFYNQTGRSLGRGIIKDNHYLLPRTNRIDVINISDKENITLHKQLNINAQKITPHQGSFILNNNDSLARHKLTDEFDLIQESTVNYNNDEYLYKSIQSENYIYNLTDNGTQYLSRYDISTLSSIYESAVKANFPSLNNIACPGVSALGFVNNKILAFDNCLVGMHVFKNIDNENFTYDQFITMPDSYLKGVVSKNIIYMAAADKLTTFLLSSENELVAINTYNIVWDANYSNSINIETVGDYLIAYVFDKVHLFDLTIKEEPKFLSTYTTQEWEFIETKFQYLDDTLITMANGSIQFYQINKAPTAHIDQLTISEDSSSEPLLIFADPESDVMTFTISKVTTNGEATVDELGLVYTPNSNFNGTDTITIKAQDIHENHIEHQVNITVIPVNDAPTISTSNLITNEDTDLVVQIEAGDVDGDVLSFTLDKAPSHASASLSVTGELSVQPDANFNGSDVISITVTDTNGGSYSTDISLSVAPINDSPIASNLNFTLIEDSILETTLETSDIENQSITVEVLDKSSVNGELTLSSEGAIYYTPLANYHGGSSFKIRLIDSEGASSEHDVSLTITPVDDLPVVSDESFSLVQGGIKSGGLPVKDIDEETLTYTVATNVSHGTLTLSTSGKYNYTPEATYSGSDSFTYNVSDAANTVQGKVTFSVQAKSVETESSSSEGGGSINFALILLLMLNVAYRYRITSVFK
ncbi:MAG: Ig-like domain-containing protein [Cocleimonas sp.]